MLYLTRKEIAEDIRAMCGGSSVISFGKAAKYLGMSPNTARQFLADVPSYQLGRKKCYMALDLARYLETRQVSAVNEMLIR